MCTSAIYLHGPAAELDLSERAVRVFGEPLISNRKKKQTNNQTMPYDHSKNKEEIPDPIKASVEGMIRILLLLQKKLSKYCHYEHNITYNK